MSIGENTVYCTPKFKVLWNTIFKHNALQSFSPAMPQNYARSINILKRTVL